MKNFKTCVLLMSLFIFNNAFALQQNLDERTKYIYFNKNNDSLLFSDSITTSGVVDSAYDGNFKTKIIYSKISRKYLSNDSLFGFTSIPTQFPGSDRDTLTQLLKVYQKNDTLRIAPIYAMANFQYTSSGTTNTISSLHENLMIDGKKSTVMNGYNILEPFTSTWQSLKPPFSRMMSIPGLGVVQMRYQKSEKDTTQWCNPSSDMKDYECIADYYNHTSDEMPIGKIDTLPASPENPYHQSYYLRYIIEANGDTTFDYHRDIIKWAPTLATLPKAGSHKIENIAGTWILPKGFEVKSVERILVNGSSQKLNYRIQNQKLELFQLKNRNAVEWVRIVPQNGVARTLRWE
jgi:hypothetical protein